MTHQKEMPITDDFDYGYEDEEDIPIKKKRNKKSIWDNPFEKYEVRQ